MRFETMPSSPIRQMCLLWVIYDQNMNLSEAMNAP